MTCMAADRGVCVCVVQTRARGGGWDAQERSDDDLEKKTNRDKKKRAKTNKLLVHHQFAA